MSRKTNARFTVESITSQSERDAGREALKHVKQLQAIDADVVAAIIAAGPLDLNRDFLSAALWDYAKADGAFRQERPVETACKRLEQAMVADKTEPLEALTGLKIDCIEAGYVFGVAVGMAIAGGQPFALAKTGGAR
jgi:hypothetical protein